MLTNGTGADQHERGIDKEPGRTFVVTPSHLDQRGYHREDHSHTQQLRHLDRTPENTAPAWTDAERGSTSRRAEGAGRDREATEAGRAGNRRVRGAAAGGSADAGARGSGDGGAGGRRKPKRSHSAVGASIVAGAAMAAVFAYILTNGGSASDDAGSPPPVVVTTTSAVPTPDKAPSINATKADRKPPVSTTSAPPPNTGPTSPVFQRGQWIAILDTYPTDAGMDADQLAKNLAGKLIAAGVPAKAMLADGQYPGLADSDLLPFRDTWIVYVGPTGSSESAAGICESPKTLKAFPGPACATYEPATRG